ncbi:clathrin adaptor complex small chain-domain-containing protein [Tricharina praecox]|uniref:clathrin adaptor complex small chain-domain-containing protein n=1 Tax=Tricharina praecox TaxID=43433 RepID=UPI002220E4A2|nr:clathrin adaptor complex small chain-domain-containing protein [Tricharina praecox]KAI5858457.1 clathrin adaptor complex small chain-domain-containing protein [Tricharina praecox]
MINAVLVFNNNGQPRLAKFYSQIDQSLQQRLLTQIFTLISTRPSNSCNFLPLPPLLSSPSQGEQITLLYRHYATLYFIIISDSLESPLGLLDLIQVFVQALDQLFENVCELDLIFNFETLHATLEEMVVGGCVVETDLKKVVDAVRGAEKGGKKGAGGGGGGMGGGGGQGGGGGGIAGVVGGLGRGGFMGEGWGHR